MCAWCVVVHLVTSPTHSLKSPPFPPLVYPPPSPPTTPLSPTPQVRHMEIGRKDFELKHVEEAFTSQNWLVRIYRVKKDGNRVERK